MRQFEVVVGVVVLSCAFAFFGAKAVLDLEWRLAHRARRRRRSRVRDFDPAVLLRSRLRGRG